MVPLLSSLAVLHRLCTLLLTGLHAAPYKASETAKQVLVRMCKGVKYVGGMGMKRDISSRLGKICL